MASLKVKVTDPSNNVYTTELKYLDKIFIGQNSENNSINLKNDSSVEERHACLSKLFGTWWVENLSSKGNTFYKGSALKEIVPLKSQDTIIVGQTKLELEFKLKGFLDYDNPKGDYSPDEEIIEGNQVENFDEEKRIGILSELQEIIKLPPRQQLKSIVSFLREKVPKAERASILIYHDKQALPVAFYPDEKSYISFTLTQRAILKGKGFIWSPPDDEIPGSVLGVAQAIYTPIKHDELVRGVIHLDTMNSDPKAHFSENDFSMVKEIATSIGVLMKDATTKSIRQVPSIFISYSRTDTEVGKELAHCLRRKPISVWFDQRIQVGQDFWDEILRAIESVDALVLIVTKASLSSDSVKNEWKYARSLRKPILPLMFEKEEIALPAELQRIHYVKCNGNIEYCCHELFERLYSLRDNKLS